MGATLLAAIDGHLPRWVANTIAILIAATVTVLCVLLVLWSVDGPIVYWFGGWRPRHGITVGIAFAIDPLGAGLAALSGLIATLALAYAAASLETAGNLFQALMLAFLAALVGFGLTGDLFNLFVFFEIMSASAYALCGYKLEDEAALGGAFNFGVTNTVGAVLIVLGLALLYTHTGTLNLAQMGTGPAHVDPLTTLSFVLLVCGYLVKAAAVPFHFWLADAHAVAPTPVCTLFSGVMVVAGLFAVARLAWTAFVPLQIECRPQVRIWLIAMGTLTGVVGAVLCFAQRHIKRMLAFSTIGHMGIMLTGVGLLDGAALHGTAVYAVGHGLVKAALFFAVGIILDRLRSVDELRLRGRGRAMPAVTILMGAGGLALAGAPPFATFAGDHAIQEAARQAGYTWLTLLSLAVAVLTGASVLRVAGRVWGGWGPRHQQVDDLGGQEDEMPETAPGHRHRFMLAPPAFCLLLALAAGSWASLDRGAAHAAARFVAPEIYRNVVLGIGQTPSAPPLQDVARSLAPGLLSAMLAITVATLSLAPGTLAERLRRITHSVLRPILHSLRVVHDGHAGEYVAWLVLGVAVWGTLLALLIRARG
jgi:multicomponent Na+:H+ antiporter subunit D